MIGRWDSARSLHLEGAGPGGPSLLPSYSPRSAAAASVPNSARLPNFLLVRQGLKISTLPSLSPIMLSVMLKWLLLSISSVSRVCVLSLAPSLTFA